MRGLVSLVCFGACGFNPRSAATSIDASPPVDAPPAATSCTGYDDTTVTMHVGGDPTKPWLAFCHGGSAFLTVTEPNFGQYTAGGQSPGSNVRTTYTRLQIDPAVLTIDICNTTFATSSGSLRARRRSPPVTTMPLGIAMSCDNNYSSSSVANVDLTGPRHSWSRPRGRRAATSPPARRRRPEAAVRSRSPVAATAAGTRRPARPPTRSTRSRRRA